MEPPVVFLSGPRIHLRPWGEAELPTAVRWINDPEIRQYILVTRPTDMLGEKTWFQNLDRTWQPHDVVLAVARNEDDAPIGSVGLHGVDWVSRHGEVGVILDPAFQGQGYGTEALRLLVDHAFDSLGLHRVESRVYAFNPRSAHLMRKLGMTMECAARDRVFRFGAWHDELFFGLLEGEWRAHRAAMEPAPTP